MTTTERRPAPDSPEAADAGVIEDARRRQRRHRLGGAALVAGALALAGAAIGSAGGGHGPAARPGVGARPAAPIAGLRNGVRATTSPAGGVDQLGLLAPGVGWVDSGQATYFTRDGGRSWTRVKAIGPSALLSGASSPGPGQVVFSLADGAQAAHSCGHGCMTATTVGVGTSPAQRGQLVLTRDAGRSWSARAFPAGAIPSAISFPNSHDGFVIAYRPSAHHNTAPSLSATRDGGREWSRVTRPPFQGLLSFANARDGLGGGWALGAGPVDSAAVYRTSDGGRTWRRTPLCRPATVYACEAPRLFASGHGVVLVSAQDPQVGGSQVAVYTTRNDGRSWTRHVLPDTPTLTNARNWVPFSAPNANDLFALVGTYLYSSSDGGARWSRRHEPALVPFAMAGLPGTLVFASAAYGWYGAGPVFAYTTDGGRRWTSMAAKR